MIKFYQKVKSISNFKVIPKLKCIYEEIKFYLKGSKLGEQIREGFQISIIGLPNSGKSSLLNIISKKNSSIVSNIAGTTRDIISVFLNLNGFPIIISDTAGINEHTNNIIEIEGINRAIKK
jgi:tRNA modification GTPase